MRSLSVLLALCTACVAQLDGDPPESDDGHASISASVAAPDADDDDYDVCEHLPAEPPCSLICDREALTEYVPESSCAVFACVLTDGREVAVHACHPR